MSHSLVSNAAPQPFKLDDLQSSPASAPSQPTLSDVELDLRIELGRIQMRLEDVLRLRAGSLVVLDNDVNSPVDVFVNDRLIARGEIVVMDERFCIRVTELVSG